jgi:cysteinyl-tRNA synthetase
MNRLEIYNTLTRTKEVFQPLNPPFVGMYVCGPTVYGHAHLGHARSALTFDVVFRYLKHLGYQVRYVRNVTDVGHLTDEVHGEGEDKLIKQARLEKLEPMEVAQRFTDSYHRDMDALNNLRPSIEPRASGHIPEQISMIREIMDKGFAYESNGSVYFSVRKYNEAYPYGILSGRKVEDLMEGYRELEGQEEKHDRLDFALWKKADSGHIMQWDSPWGVGFPGWHIECTAMSTKYLGPVFDIHGGGLDLMFPHHEAEVAQANAAHHPCAHEHRNEARYWLHCNMITIGGQKMGKSLNNSISLHQFYSGDHQALDKAYPPMAIRFFVLQGHYRSTLDFSNEGLTAAWKAWKKLSLAYEAALIIRDKGNPSVISVPEFFGDAESFGQRCSGSMNDDLNTAKVIAEMFGVQGLLQKLSTEPSLLNQVPAEAIQTLAQDYIAWFSDILGLLPESGGEVNGRKDEALAGLVEILIQQRKDAKAAKDFEKADAIRKQLEALHIYLKDSREGVSWTYEPDREI